jgi:hypothetical protein
MVSLTPETESPLHIRRPLEPNPPPAETGHGLGTRKTLALVVGGAGVVGIGVGTAVGLVALSNKNSALALCPASPAGNVCPNLMDANAVANANSTGNVSAVLLIAGGAAVVGGAVLWLTAPRANRGPTTRLGVGPGSVQLLGSW